MTPDALIKKAWDLLKNRYCEDGHHSVIAAALLTKSGKVFTSLNTGTNQPSVATCAEMIAIGMANTDAADMEIDLIVAVRGWPEGGYYIVSPCGRCREYILDYGPNARVIVPADNKKGYTVVPATDLLPNKYRKK